MQKRLIALEEQFKREKLQADQEFEEQRKVSYSQSNAKLCLALFLTLTQSH